MKRSHSTPMDGVRVAAMLAMIAIGALGAPAHAAPPFCRTPFGRPVSALAGTRGLATARALAITPERFPDQCPPVHKTLPNPSRSGIEHVVVVMMENRSFDHLLGWHPTADADQSQTFVDRQGAIHQTYPLAPDYMGCDHPDPDHSFEGGRAEYNGGRMDGFLRAGSNDEFAIGFYVEPDRPFFSAFAREFTTCDRSFASIMAETFPNRVFQHAAQTDRVTNTFDISSLPTIWDRLDDAGVSGRYYYSDVSFLWLWGLKYESISASYDDFLDDAASGNLPAVSFVEPRFLGDQSGTSGSDHPHADVRVGDAFLAEAFHAVLQGPAWPSTVFVVTYDEWGGFFDHVPPPRAAAPNDVDPDVVGGKALLGMRVPTIVASPFSRKRGFQPRVDSTVYDHTSILKMIEWRWGLRPLTRRDASNDVGNLAEALDFDHPDRSVPVLPKPGAPPINSCGLGVASTATASSDDPWTAFAIATLPVAKPAPER